MSDRLRLCLKNMLQQFEDLIMSVCFPRHFFQVGREEAPKISSLTAYHQNFNSIHILMKIKMFNEIL